MGQQKLRNWFMNTNVGTGTTLKHNKIQANLLLKREKMSL